jgi:hypothetical protein
MTECTTSKTPDAADRISGALAKFESDWGGALGGGSLMTSSKSDLTRERVVDLAQFRKCIDEGGPNSDIEVIMKTLLWLLSDDTGVSSKAIILAGSGISGDGLPLHPAGPYEFGRCVRLLRKIPELREPAFRHLKKEGGEIWGRLVDRWDEIVECLEEETGIEGSRTEKAPRTYALMRGVMNGGG